MMYKRFLTSVVSNMKLRRGLYHLVYKEYFKIFMSTSEYWSCICIFEVFIIILDECLSQQDTYIHINITKILLITWNECNFFVFCMKVITKFRSHIKKPVFYLQLTACNLHSLLSTDGTPPSIFGPLNDDFFTSKSRAYLVNQLLIRNNMGIFIKYKNILNTKN